MYSALFLGDLYSRREYQAPPSTVSESYSTQRSHHRSMASRTHIPRHGEGQLSMTYSPTPTDNVDTYFEQGNVDTYFEQENVDTSYDNNYYTSAHEVDKRAVVFNNYEPDDLSSPPLYYPDHRVEPTFVGHYSSRLSKQRNGSFNDNNSKSSRTSGSSGSARQVSKKPSSRSATRFHGNSTSVSKYPSQGCHPVENAGNDPDDCPDIIPEEAPYPDLVQANVHGFQEQYYRSDSQIDVEDGTQIDEWQEFQKTYSNLSIDAEEQVGAEDIFHAPRHSRIDTRVERWRTIKVEYRNSTGDMQTLTALKDSGNTVGNVITKSAVDNLGLCSKISYFEKKALIKTFIGSGPIALGIIDLTAAAQTETFTVLNVHHHYDIVLDAAWCFKNDALARGKSHIDYAYIKDGYEEGYEDGYAAGSGRITTGPRGEIHILGWSKKESRQEREKNTQNSRAKNSKAAAAEAKRKNRQDLSGLKTDEDEGQPEASEYWNNYVAREYQDAERYK
ncbi:hypothetical protein V8F06_009136 [Rhypophila decipiens]